MTHLNVLSPVGTVRPVAATGLAPRPGDLAGLRIGLLDNGKPSSRELLQRAARLLGERFGTEVTIERRKRNTSLPAEHDQIDEIAARIDLALVGTGD
jgi:hypothetical protein